MMTEELVMVGYYDYRLVALSVVISVLESYAARNLSERLRNSHGISSRSRSLILARERLYSSI